MSATAKDVFDTAIERAKHLLTLYDLLHDSRQRGIRQDWAKSLCKIMHWPVAENITRIDGIESQSILLLRESLGLSREQFKHKYVSELLRATIVAAVSAVDRYLHDQIVAKSISLLGRKEDEVPTALKNLRLSVLTVKRSMEKLRKDPASRPGWIIKKEIQNLLHKEETFQSVSGIEKAAKLLGLNDLWRQIAGKFRGTMAENEIRERISTITLRRNQIVHEADVILYQRTSKIKLREITKAEAKEAVNFVESFIIALESLVNESC